MQLDLEYQDACIRTPVWLKATFFVELDKPMRGQIWRTSQECHHLALIVLKSCRDELRIVLAGNVAQFLKPPESLTRLHVLAMARFDSSEPDMPDKD